MLSASLNKTFLSLSHLFNDHLSSYVHYNFNKLKQIKTRLKLWVFSHKINVKNTQNYAQIKNYLERPTSPKAPRPMILRVSKSSRWRRYALILLTTGFAETKIHSENYVNYCHIPKTFQNTPHFYEVYLIKSK